MSGKAKNRPQRRNKLYGLSCDMLFKLRWAVHVHCIGMNQAVEIAKNQKPIAGPGNICGINGEPISSGKNEDNEKFIEQTKYQLQMYALIEQGITEELTRRGVLSVEMTPDQMLEAGPDYPLDRGDARYRVARRLYIRNGVLGSAATWKSFLRKE